MNLKHALTRFYYKSHYNINVENLSSRSDGDFMPWAMAAVYAAKADNHFSHAEKDHIRGGFLASGRSEAFLAKLEELFDQDFSLDDIKASAAKLSESDRRGIIASTFDICSSDDLSKQEEQHLIKVAGVLGVSEEVVHQFKDIYVRKRQLQKDRMAIIGSDWFKK